MSAIVQAKTEEKEEKKETETEEKEEEVNLEDLKKNIDGFVKDIENLPQTVGKGFETLPQEIFKFNNYIAENRDAVIKLSGTLVDGAANKELIQNLAGTLSMTFANIDKDAVQKNIDAVTGNVLDTGIKSFEQGILTNPLTGIPFVIAMSFANILKTGVKSAEGMLKIFNNAIQQTANKLPPVPSLTDKKEVSLLPPPPPSKISSKKVGGAKTRRHLKRVIRDRELIQTRTNKMISEFLGRATTQNKKYISKKSKRRRRR
jgi:hypothetical protein